MNLLLLYLLLSKAVVTSFSGMASLPVVRNDFVVTRHILTDRQLNTAIVAGRTGPGPNGLYLVSVGYFAAVRRGPLGGRAGWRIAGGPILQALDDGEHFWTLAAGTGPWVSGSVNIVRGLQLSVSGGLDGMLLRRDQTVEGALWPSASVTLELRM